MEVLVHCEDQPQYWDHSKLAFLNKIAEQKGMGPIFDWVTEINPDNGEIFVSAYFKQQLIRNQRKQIDKTTYLCTFHSCVSPAITTTTVAAAAASTSTRNDNPPLLIQPVGENFETFVSAAMTRQINTTTQTMAPIAPNNNTQYL
jgi:hypothetical protein